MTPPQFNSVQKLLSLLFLLPATIGAATLSPVDEASSLAIIQDPETSELRLTWTRTDSRAQVLEQSQDLVTWEVIETTESAYVIPSSPGLAPQTFYRLVASSASAPQNVLLIIVDDWGIDSSPIDNPNGPNLPLMPTLERLAEEGMRFTRAYALPMCSPTRASILTGRYPFRHGVGSPGGVNLPDSEQTLAETFTACSDYRNASFGKWHLGGGASGPVTDGGWPQFKGSLGAGLSDYFQWQKTVATSQQPATTSTTTTYATTDTTNDAIEWITDQGTAPWFCWIGYNAAHSTFHDPPATIDGQANPYTNTRRNRDRYEAMLWALDTEIGRLLRAVDREKTNIILVGDNGTPGRMIQAPFTREHSKGTLYEGGTRVPLVITGPSVTASPGTTDQLTHCADIFPTILDLAGVSPGPAQTQIDGQSLVPLLQGASESSRTVVCEAFGRGVDRPGRALRNESHKLIIYEAPTNGDPDTLELYNLAADPNEQNNLIGGTLTSADRAAQDALWSFHNALGGWPLP